MKNKSFIAIVVIFLCVALTFAAIFVVTETNHDCDGEDCHVCELLQVAVNTIRFTIVALLVLVLFAGISSFRFVASFIVNAFFRNDPVAMKTKISA